MCNPRKEFVNHLSIRGRKVRDIDFDAVCSVVRAAGQAIMQVSATGDFRVELKDDDSPITRADRASNEIIVQALSSLYPEIPILSEESPKPPLNERAAWERFWLVDPLDGTKEFVKQNGEFSVCVGLLEKGRPVFGAVYGPVRDVLYAGGPGMGSVKQAGSGRMRINARGPQPGEAVVVVGSRSHPDSGLAAYLERFPKRHALAVGSSLKFGMVACGEAHLYPRSNRTWEWDTAAGHALVLGAGGVFKALGGGEFAYNKPSLENGGFVAAGWDAERLWA